MINFQTGKWGRAVIAAALAASLALFSSCGTDQGSASTDNNGNMAGYSDQSAESSAANEKNSSADPIGRLSGKFCIDGNTDAASVVIDEDGRFTAYYASGTAEQSGYVRYEADDSGYHVYVFYTDEGKPYMGFVDSGESRISEFETGNGGYRYVRVG